MDNDMDIGKLTREGDIFHEERVIGNKNLEGNPSMILKFGLTGRTYTSDQLGFKDHGMVLEPHSEFYAQEQAKKIGATHFVLGEKVEIKDEFSSVKRQVSYVLINY